MHGFKAKDYRYYMLVGGGLYRYKAVNENLVYPRQTTTAINLGLLMDTQVDQRYTLGGNFGFGVEGFVTDNLSVDLRGRYTFVVGELRPLLYYGLERTRPLHTLDVGASLKFYFWR
jgi:opacity protein-like surface antigen